MKIQTPTERCPSCRCEPVVAKVGAGRWVVACPDLKGCWCNIVGRGTTEKEAIQDWNEKAVRHG